MNSSFISQADIHNLKSKARSRSKALSARPDPGACKSDNRPNQSEESFRDFASNKSSAPSKTIKTIVSVPSKHFFDPNSAPKINSHKQLTYSCSKETKHAPCNYFLLPIAGFLNELT